MTDTAVFSPCRRYRYRLERNGIGVPLFDKGRTVTFVMLNPSTADETQNDPTVRRCIGFAQREGASRLIVVNLFALRSTDPSALLADMMADPVGCDNDDAILQAMNDADLVVAAWGAHGAVRAFQRDVAAETLSLICGRKLQCLGTTKAGAPRHPLYVAADTPLAPWCYSCEERVAIKEADDGTT